MMIGMENKREELSYDSKIAGRSIPSVHDPWDEALRQHQKARQVKYQGTKLSAEAFTNAIVMHFLELDFEEQSNILAEYVPQFEERVVLRKGRKAIDSPLRAADRITAKGKTTSKSKKQGTA